MSLAEKQQALLAERESALASLGLGELAHSLSSASAAAKDALKRGAGKKRAAPAGPADASAATSVPLRRSTRAVVTGIAEDGSAMVRTAPAAPVIAAVVRERPEGTAPWHAHLDSEREKLARQDDPATVAAALLSCMRDATAEWIGAPRPSPLAPPVAPPAAATAETGDVGAGAPPPPAPPPTFDDAGIASAALLLPHCDAGIWPLVDSAPPEAAARGSPRRPAGIAPAEAGLFAPGSRDPSVLGALRLTDARSVMKVVDDRIYSIGLHPAPGRVIAFAGDSSGHLGVWVPDAGASGADGGDAEPKRPRTAVDGTAAATAAAEEDDDDADGDNAGASTTACFAPHVAPINCMQVPRGAPHLIVTSSFDGSIRALDLNAGASWELSTAALGGAYGGLATGGKRASKYAAGFSAFDVTAFEPAAGGAAAPALVLAAGGYSGAGFVIDTRERPDAAPAAAWAAHEGKVTAVSALHGPGGGSGGGGPHIIMTSCSSSGGEGSVCLWDVRRLPKPATRGGGARGSDAAEPLLRVPHPKGVINAYFSPHGAYAVSTCNDDYLRVWDVAAAAAKDGGAALRPSPSAPRATIAHDNHTGQWLTQFRPVFDPANDATLLLGAMGTRALEVWSVPSGRKLASLTSEFITAVPTLSAVHPCPRLNVVVSASASGRLYLWR